MINISAIQVRIILRGSLEEVGVDLGFEGGRRFGGAELVWEGTSERKNSLRGCQAW